MVLFIAILLYVVLLILAGIFFPFAAIFVTIGFIAFIIYYNTKYKKVKAERAKQSSVSTENSTPNPSYNKEIRVKCDTCGHIFCYTQADLIANKRNANQALLSSALSVMNAFGGTMYGAYASDAQSDRASAKVVDYSKCPKCNSRNIRILSEEEQEQEKIKQAPSTPAVSSADELKKFKELLDTGIITQEEFDAKKKDLLGL